VSKNNFSPLDGAALTEKEVAGLKKLAQLVASGVFDKTVLNKAEAAGLLGIKPRTMDEWIRRRRGPPFSKLPSGGVRFRRDQLLEFLEKFEVK
jgi:hypothetical protein